MRNKTPFLRFCSALISRVDEHIDRTVYLTSNPVTGDQKRDKLYYWVGDDSDSPRRLVHLVMKSSLTSIGFDSLCDVKRVFFLKVPQERKGQNNFFVSVETGIEAYLCGGMTDYSGAGSQALKDALEMLAFLSSSLGIKLEMVEGKAGDDDRIQELVNEAWLELVNETWEENQGGDKQWNQS